MPLVFAQNEVSLSDLSYADVMGESYEYPARYKGLVQPGEQFVYYRGGRRTRGPRVTPVYLGAGIVGHVTEVGDRFRCSIRDFKPFTNPLAFKDAKGLYREPEANNRRAVGFYFQTGVRTIDQAAYDAICKAGARG
jgi:hypothetical protein